jgi:hypothetical protein
MPRKDYSQQTQRHDPADSHGDAPGSLGGPRGGDDAEAASDTWLDNPRNIQAFFDAIDRARRAKSRERPS